MAAFDLLESLHQLRKNHVQQVYFSKSGKMFYRSANSWVMIEPPQEQDCFKSAFELLLTPIEQEQFTKFGTVKKIQSQDEVVWQICFSRQENEETCHIQFTAKGYLNNRNQTITDLIAKKSLRAGGLSLFVGPAHSGKSSLMMSLASELSIKEKKAIAIVSDDPLWSAWINEFSGNSICTYFSDKCLSNQESENDFLQSTTPYFDVIFIDVKKPFGYRFLHKILSAGRSVIVSSSGMDVLSVLGGLVYLSSSIQSDALKKYLFSELAQVFSLGINLRIVPARETGWAQVSELLLGNENISTEIASENFDKIRNSIGLNTEAGPTQNLNQSLLGLILKRKIEVKTGFENSPNPEQLEQLLKKVGY